MIGKFIYLGGMTGLGIIIDTNTNEEKLSGASTVAAITETCNPCFLFLEKQNQEI